MVLLVACDAMADRRGIRRPRRTWPQRLLLSLNVFAILVSLASAGFIAYAHDTVGETQRTAILGVDGWVPAEQVAPGDPIDFLVVGNDSADGLDPGDPALDGRDDVGGARSDVI